MIERYDDDGSRLVTAYFRSQFQVADASAIAAVTLDLLADDGAVVWLNGQRVVNDNMTTGPVDYGTLSSSGRWGSAERTAQQHAVLSSALATGTNTIAIEVHQRDPNSSDLSFDARLRLTTQSPTPSTTTSTTAPPTTTTPPTTTVPPTTTTTPPGPSTITPIALGADWRHWSHGPVAGSWASGNFDDSGWQLGAGQLGFGDGDENTVINRNVDSGRVITAYFRSNFDVDDAGRIDDATLSILADDGAVVWLNGQRVVDDNMTAGPVDYGTLSSSGRWGSAETTFREFALPASAFVDGTNVLAVEVHQREEYSSDLSFDASLTLDLSGR